MKSLIIVLIVLAAGGVAFFWAAPSSSSKAGKVALSLPWDGTYALPVPQSLLVPDASGNKVLTIQPSFDEHTPFRAALFRISNPPLGHRFALEGTVSYTNLPDNTALEMTACYLINTSTVTSGEHSDNLGPDGRLIGSSTSRPFILTMAMMPQIGPLLELDLDVYIGGHSVEDAALKGQKTSISLSNLRVVSYPEPTASEAALMLGVLPTPEKPFSWRSFCQGIAFAAVLALAMAQTVVLVRRLRKLRADREMRQISSLDG